MNYYNISTSINVNTYPYFSNGIYIAIVGNFLASQNILEE
jgi:hypothetical protein